MHYFSSCKTPAEAKQLYRQLALEHHPDRGGDTKVMQDINTQYAHYLKGTGYDFKNFHNDYSSDELFRDFEQFVEKNPELAIYAAIGVGVGIVLNTLMKFSK